MIRPAITGPAKVAAWNVPVAQATAFGRTLPGTRVGTSDARAGRFNVSAELLMALAR